MSKTYKDAVTREPKPHERISLRRREDLEDLWESVQGRPAPLVDIREATARESQLTCPICGWTGRGFLYKIERGQITVICPHRKCRFRYDRDLCR